MTSDDFNKDGPRAPFAWYGGKAKYAKAIIERFPQHTVYLEPYCGAANILLRKHRSKVEVINDLDNRVTNFFAVVRDETMYEELSRLLNLTPHSRQEFASNLEGPEPECKVKRAARFFIRCRQSRGGIGMSKLTPSSWAVSTRTRRGMAEGVSKYLSAIDGLQEVAERLRTVSIESMPALDFIDKYDSADALFYCDPPYVPKTRHGAKAAMYRFEMRHWDHKKLLERLLQVQGKVILSGYPSELYDTMLANWRRVEFEARSHMSNSGQQRIEVLWMNFDEEGERLSTDGPQAVSE